MNVSHLNPAAERRIETAERQIPASPTEIFRLLTDIRRHAAIDDSGMLRGEPTGPQTLNLGSRFTMAMEQGGLGDRSVNLEREVTGGNTG